MPNFFCAVFEHYKEDQARTFIVHKLCNQFHEFVTFLKECKDLGQWHIGYNNLAFDSQITQFILVNSSRLLAMADPEEIAKEIYEKAQQIVDRGNSGSDFPEWPEKELLINQIDLFKLNHWDNPAKRSSLKWIQYSMDWHNLLDMPIHHSTEITSQEQIDIVLDYCRNDVRSTKMIYEKSREQIALRDSLSKEYGINLYSASEPRISKELFLHFLSKETRMHKYDIKQSRSIRKEIAIDKIILDYISFSRPEFKQLLNNFRKLVVDPNNTKGGFKYSVRYKGVTTDFGLGGLHGANDTGIYQATKDMIIMTSDVVSFYPNLAIRNKWAPGHIENDVFCRLYEWFFEERKKIPKKDPKNYVYKIILNSTYGLSNDINSFLYDPEFTMRITINGQLSLAMLYEMICERIPDAVPIMQNTDGLETMIPADKKEEYLKVCKEWEALTKLELEHDEYEKLILADVNNYIAIGKWKEIKEEEYKKMEKEVPHGLYKAENGSFYYKPIKCKGRFEFSGLALHKNKSFLIIPKAIYYYFVHGTAPDKYLLLNRNILDYCAGVKAKGDWTFYETCIVNGEVQRKELQHTIRYYITKEGCKLLKYNKVDGREIQLDSGKWLQRVFTKMESKSWKEYKVDDSYYLEQIEKEIKNITPVNNQLSMF